MTFEEWYDSFSVFCFAARAASIDASLEPVTQAQRNVDKLIMRKLWDVAIEAAAVECESKDCYAYDEGTFTSCADDIRSLKTGKRLSGIVSP